MNELLKKLRDEILNPISPTFCAAKWYETCIWLQHGIFNSCCHCEIQSMNFDSLETGNFKELLNNRMVQGKRYNLLNGIQDYDCNYCWNVENTNPNSFSDRTMFSTMYTEDQIKECKEIYDYRKTPPIRVLQIVFDNLCNLGCAYCDQFSSSVWQTEIKTIGLFNNITNVDFKIPANKDPIKLQKMKELFWKWLKEDSSETILIRISGGEPTMSPDFWKFLSIVKENNLKFGITLNTNLILSEKKLDSLIELSHTHVGKFNIATSNEAIGSQAEFLRDGLSWEKWINNVERCLANGNFEQFRIVATINLISLFTVIDLLNEILRLKQKYPNLFFRVINLTHPIYLRINCLPREILIHLQNNLKQWRIDNQIEIRFPEFINPLNLIDSFIDQNLNNLNESGLFEFKSFIDQYEKRRHLNFKEAFKNYPLLVEL